MQKRRIAAMVIGGLVIGAAAGCALLSENGYSIDKHPAVVGDNHPAIVGENLNAGMLAGGFHPGDSALTCADFFEQDESTAVINGEMKNPSDVEYVVAGCGGFL